MKTAIVRALVAASLAVGVHSAGTAQIVVEGYAEPTIRVAHNDLDLRDASDVTTLRARVWKAATELCLDARTSVPTARDGFNCRALTFRDARPQIAEAVSRRVAGRYAAANPIVVRLR